MLLAALLLLQGGDSAPERRSRAGRRSPLAARLRPKTAPAARPLRAASGRTLPVAGNAAPNRSARPAAPFRSPRSEPAQVERRLREALLEGRGERYCLTSLALDARRCYAALSPAGRRLASQILFRPTSNPDYYSGVNIAYPPDAEVHTIENGAFRVHYVTEGSQAATVEYAQKAAQLMPEVHARIVSLMGFRTPPGDGQEGGGQNAYDVYITDLPSGIAGFCSASGVVGTGWASYIVVDNKLSLKDDATATNLSTTLAHEYFHASQYAYDPAERTWWKEATAVWAQDQVFDDPNDYVLLLEPRFRNPSLPLDTADGRTEYATALFARYLTEAIDPTLIRRIWEKQAANRGEPVPENTLPAIKEALAENGRTLGEAICGTLEWMYRKENFEEGYLYPTLTLTARYSAYPAVISSDGLAAGNLSHLSAHVLLFERPSSPASAFSITFDGSNSHPFHVEALAVGTGGNADKLFRMELTPASSGNLFIEGLGTLYDRAAVVVCNTSPYTGGASYGLSVATSPPGVMKLDKYELVFETAEGEQPAPLGLFLGNEGEGELDWSAESSAEWLSVSPSSGTVEPGGVQALGVRADVSGLAAERSPYTAYIVFRSANASNSPQTVDVTLKLIFSSPHIQVVPHALSTAFPQAEGAVPLEPLTVSNGGNGVMTVRLSSSADWLVLSRSSLRLGAREEDTVGLTVLASRLTMSDEPYRAVITLASPDALNSPVTVDVECTVLPPGTLGGGKGGMVAVECGYSWEDIASEEYDLTSWFTNLDDGAAGFYLPFPFTFYGRGYGTDDVFYVSTNGFITFKALGSSSASNHSFPSALIPNAVIAPFWTDLDLRPAGKIYGRTVDDEDGRRFLIQYEGVYTAEGEGPFSFQTAVYESGEIVFRYRTDMRGAAKGTVGVEDESGGEGLTLAFDEPASFPAAGTAFRLLPSASAPLLALSPRLLAAAVPLGGAFDFRLRVESSSEGKGSWRLSAEGAALSFSPSEGEGSAEVLVSGIASFASPGQYPVFVRLEGTDCFVGKGEAGVLLDVYEGEPESRTLELSPGWNAIALPLFPRSSWTVADIFGAAEGNPVREVRLYRGEGAQVFLPGEGAGEPWLFGEGALVFSERKSSIAVRGDRADRSLHLIRAGDNLVWSPAWEGKDVAEALDAFPEGTVRHAVPWEGAWLRPFAPGTGRGTPVRGPLLVRSMEEFFLSLRK